MVGKRVATREAERADVTKARVVNTTMSQGSTSSSNINWLTPYL
ncbi:hypothetical protein OESDEN_22468 [Oesophagostomum dentatum]|uniref:Uncharacterized protein n=1 Tax=Oesophagostomum dentatum TaxID=61180 RepID=A0A0B1S351_OESDE|nr:hypothetical protein OESDEN_22468 [Oesophagostomum dentatum]